MAAADVAGQDDMARGTNLGLRRGTEATWQRPGGDNMHL